MILDIGESDLTRFYNALERSLGRVLMWDVMGIRFMIGRSEDLLDAGVGESELASAPLNKTFSSLMVGYFNILQDSPERKQRSSPNP
jgi:hypothetical protein